MKNDRINVRANTSMKDELKFLRFYLEKTFNRKFSDSEVIEYLLKYANDKTYNFIDFVKPYIDYERGNL